ncbi:MAG: RHS repeat protein [Acidobacteria bacterium]|nr:MAG: RHS repeat protein [Acidobacteriota bacterium]MCE7958814.1 RHS repeat protein [Acidobacteria bacterium ACB2]
MDGPRTDAADVTTYEYYGTGDTPSRRGRPSHLTDPAGNVTTYDDYDDFGTARHTTDPNGVVTDLVSDGRGRVTRRISRKPVDDPDEPADYVTMYAFDGRDRLTSTTLPRGNVISYGYEDGTNRLLTTTRLDFSSNQVERLRYVLDDMGHTVTEDAQGCDVPASTCASWTTARTESFTYDNKARLHQVVHPDASSLSYNYDADGLLWKVRDERHVDPNVVYGYDERHRLASVTQKQGLAEGPDVVTGYGYDAHDNLTSVDDPNGTTTTHVYDDFGRLQRQTSPVSGTTTYTYDASGNLLTSSDANGATTTRAYDAAGRVTSAVSTRVGYTTETVTYTYDDKEGYGRGRLNTMTDPAGSVGYFYERRGLLRQEGRSLSSTPYLQGYAYDANGNRTRVAYPSGRVVDYTYDFADRPLSAAASVPAAQPYVDSATYAPFGPRRTLAMSNGTLQTTTYDASYRPVGNRLERTPSGPVLFDQTLTPDGTGNVTSVTESVSGFGARTFAYDDLNRLTTAQAPGLWGTDSADGYTYDAMGNLLTLRLGASRTATFSYQGTTPLLTSVTEDGNPAVVTHDEVGNVTGTGSLVLRYSARNLLASVVPGSGYSYDGTGLRRTKTVWGPPALRRHFFYTPEMRLLSETDLTDATPTPIDDYVWLGKTPVAHVAFGGGKTEWYATDHLGTPVAGTSATGALAFQLQLEPYGRLYVPLYERGLTPRRVLRFPGQEQEDGTTPLRERHYNVFRWYLPAWGAYSQPDPIGQPRVVEGFGTVSRPFAQMSATSAFAYALANPFLYLDPFGLDPVPAMTPGRVAACAYAVAQTLQYSFPPGTSDKYKHCAISGLMVTICGPALNAGGTAVGVAAFLGIAKEVKDLLGPGNAEFADLLADYRGLKCGLESLRGSRPVDVCCRGCYP